MRYKIEIFVFILLFGTCFAIYQFQIKNQSTDRADYLRLVAKVKPISSRKKTTPTIQHRTGVQKEIWTAKHGTRTLFRLNCDSSTLVITPNYVAKNKFSVTEKLGELYCTMQEEVDANGIQEIRTLKSKEGIYFFPDHRFVADAVDIHFYRVPGYELPQFPLQEAPYLRGKAFEVAFAAQDKSLHFTADYLKADLDPKQTFPHIVRKKK